MRIPLILATSLTAVLAGSFLLVGPFSTASITGQENDSLRAEAATLPLMIRDHFTEKKLAGDAEQSSNFKVDEDFVDPENHCEFCTRVEYKPGAQGAAGFSYEDATALDLSGAKKAGFWVMGEEGTEKVKFKLAGKGSDGPDDGVERSADRLANDIFKTERFALTTEEVTLDDDWKKYEVDLTGLDLKEVTHPFAFELSANGDEKQVIYIKGVVYDDEPAVDALAANPEEVEVGELLVVEIRSNATEGTAPATFEFEANVSGGAEPYTRTWDFGDDGQDEGQNAVHTFEEAGEYNVTLTVTDAGNQSSTDSIGIEVAEAEIIEEEADVLEEEDDNVTASEANATDT